MPPQAVPAAGKDAGEGGGLKPLRLAFGSMSLVVGVQLICLVHIVCAIVILYCCTSVAPITLVGIVIDPWKQVVGATWALLGMPLIIQGGVGALYRIKAPVMNYFYYLLATCALDMAFLLTLFYEADMCKSVMPKEYISMGPNFVCGFSDSLLFLGFMFFGLVFLYFCFIVWSMAKEIEGWQPALLSKDEGPEYDEEDDIHVYEGWYPQQQGFQMPEPIKDPQGPWLCEGQDICHLYPHPGGRMRQGFSEYPKQQMHPSGQGGYGSMGSQKSMKTKHSQKHSTMGGLMGSLMGSKK